MNTRTRIKAIPVLLAASLGLGTMSTLIKAAAREGHVAASLQPTGLEELNLVVEESGVTGMPESLEAGRYLVNVTGPEPDEMGASGAAFVQLPEGLTVEQALEDVLASEGGPPEWFNEIYFGGGVTLSQGTESWSVVDFTPGAWVVTTPFGNTLGVEFEVTGEFPADQEDVAATATIELSEMTFSIGDGELVAGENVITVNNAGTQIHFVDFSHVPDGTTREQVTAVFDSYITGTPPAADNGFAETDVVPVALVPDISPGVKMSMPLTFEAGTYFLSCWVTDPESGMPHAMMGMWDLITVE